MAAIGMVGAADVTGDAGDANRLCRESDTGASDTGASDTSSSDSLASACQFKRALLGQEGDRSSLVRHVAAAAEVLAEDIQVRRLVAILIDAIVRSNDFCGDGVDIRSELTGFWGQGLQCLCQTLRQHICQTLCQHRPETL